MAVQSTIDEINNFLVEVKALVTVGNYDFIPRPKNNLTNLGINLKIALDIILRIHIRIILMVLSKIIILNLQDLSGSLEKRRKNIKYTLN